MQLNTLGFIMIASIFTVIHTETETIAKNAETSVSAGNYDNSLNERTPKLRHGRTTFVKAILANPEETANRKLALKPAKLQKSTKKLANVKVHEAKLNDKVRNNVAYLTSDKHLHHGSSKHRRRKHRRRKQKNRKSPRKGTKSARRKGASSVKRRQKKLAKETPRFYKEIHVARLNPADTDYIDFTQSTHSVLSTTEPASNIEITEHFIKITTKDTRRKGDHGIEYSDYYNDGDIDDTLNTIQSNHESNDHGVSSGQTMNNTLYLNDTNRYRNDVKYDKNDNNKSGLESSILQVSSNKRFYLSTERPVTHNHLILYPIYLSKPLAKIPENSVSTVPSNSSYFNSLQNRWKSKKRRKKASPRIANRRSVRSKIAKSWDNKVQNLRSGYHEGRYDKGKGNGDLITEKREECSKCSEEQTNGLHKSKNKARANVSSQNASQEIAKAQRANIAVTVNQTKEVANQILSRIIDELEELKLSHSRNNEKEGLPCRLSGSWMTREAGVKIDMKVKNRKITATLDKLVPEPVKQGLINTTWNITGCAPFKRGGPFYLTATNNYTRTLAVFTGACRVCQGVDTIEGVWSVAREPKDCRDFRMATSVFNDVFRRTGLLAAMKQQANFTPDSNETTTINATTKNKWNG